MIDPSNILLAQLPAPDSFSGVGWLIVCVGALALAYNQIDEAIQRRKDKPSAGEVQQQAHANFATKTELDHHIKDDAEKLGALKLQVDAVDQDITSFRAEVAKNGDERRKSIEGKVEEARNEAAHNSGNLNREMGEVKATLKLFGQSLDQINQHIHREAK